MPINVTTVGFNAPAQAARTALMNNLNVPAPEQALFSAALTTAIFNWGHVNLDTAANPGNGVQSGGMVTYTNAAGMVQNFPAAWSVNVQNWVLHTSCAVLVTNVW